MNPKPGGLLIYIIVGFLCFLLGFFVGIPHVKGQTFQPSVLDLEYDPCGLKVVVCPNEKKVSVTAYTSEVGQTDSSPCISADGSDICKRYAEGELICATNDHPMHSRLIVPGYGECVVRDRMNKRFTGTGRVDIYLGMDLSAARSWGHRELTVTAL